METSETTVKRGIVHLRLLNFRSIAAADIALAPLTIFVGPNASGKSNIIRGLRFLRDALTIQLNTALDQEGGIYSVRRRTFQQREMRHARPADLPNLGVSARLIETTGDRVREAEYGFELSSPGRSSYKVNRERCVVRTHNGSKNHRTNQFDRHGNKTQTDLPTLPRLSSDRLLLPLLTSIESFAWVYDALSEVQTHAMSPNVLREPQKPGSSQRLEADGRNLASVIKQIRKSDPLRYERILELLNVAIPGHPRVNEKRQGDKLGLSFIQESGKLGRLTFDAFEMSDGTLRLLAILAAIFQQPSPLIIAIEEPEATIHPGAMGVLLDIFKARRDQSQVLITTHSPDILEDKDLSPDFIRLVDWQDGVTTIAPVGQAARESVEEGLMLAGELLRSNALRPDHLPSFSPSVELFPEW